MPEGNRPTREELRARLRNRIRTQRDGRGGGTEAARPTQQAEALVMSAVGDNAEAMALATALLKNPTQARRVLDEMASAATVQDSDDEEEAPPPLAPGV